MRIVMDSSANLTAMAHTDFVSVPLKIMIGEQEFTDTAEQDVREMTRAMDACTTKTSTACPGSRQWLDAYKGDDTVFAAVLTSKLSGAYSAAVAAANEYMEKDPSRRVFVLDTLTTGPELELFAEAYEEMILKGLSFDEIARKITDYRAHTHLGFILTSVDNFARNGRVSPALAKLVHLLDIRIVGRASEDGALEPQNKCRGNKKSLAQVWKNMKDAGYRGGKVRIRHTDNEPVARAVEEMILAEYPHADVTVAENRCLCAYYAEHGGLLIGYEDLPWSES